MNQLNNNILDNKNRFLWLDGLFTNQDNNIKVDTHSLHYASSVFEGIRCYEGKIFKLQEHITRLFYSMDIMHLKTNFTPQDIDVAVKTLITKNNLENCYIRILVYRGDESLIIAHGDYKAKTLILTLPSQINLPLINLDIIESSWKRAPSSSMPHQCKGSGNYTISIISSRQAIDKGYNDSLLLDYQDNIAECTTTNIFFVKDNDIYTPIAENFLNGITRQTIITLAKKIG